MRLLKIWLLKHPRVTSWVLQIACSRVAIPTGDQCQSRGKLLTNSQGRWTLLKRGCVNWVGLRVTDPNLRFPAGFLKISLLGTPICSQKFCSLFWWPLTPPPSQNSKVMHFLLNFFRRPSNRIANTQPKLQTNSLKIANKQNYEQTGVSDLYRANGRGGFWVANCCWPPLPAPEKKNLKSRLWVPSYSNYYLSNSKTLQDGNGNGNGNLGEINSKDFQDGNWESMEMKGWLRTPRQ